MEIRKALECDIEGIIKLLYQVNQVHADGRPDLFKNGGIKYTNEQVKEKINDPAEEIYVAVDDENTVLGYVMAVYETQEESTCTHERKSLYIDDLCVDETKRGQHVGKALYDLILGVAKKNNCYRVTLHAWECNPGAISFYEKIGMSTMYRAMEYVL